MKAVNLSDELLDGVGKFIADREGPPFGRMTLDDAIHAIVQDWLMSQGYMPLPEESAAITPALAAAKVP